MSKNKYRIIYKIAVFLVFTTNICFANINQQKQDYVDALYSFSDQNYRDAGVKAEKFQKNYPSSEYLQKVLLIKIMSDYFSSEDLLYGSVDDFLSLYKFTKQAEYVYLIKANFSYKKMQDKSSLSNIEKAIEDSKTLISFNGEFKSSGEEILKKSNTILAEYDYDLGYFYEYRKDYIAAIKEYERISDFCKKNNLALPEKIKEKLQKLYTKIGIDN